MLNDCRNLPDGARQRLTEAFGADFLDRRHQGFDLDYKGDILELRTCSRVEVREADDGAPMIVGYATVYDFPYDVYGGPKKGGWTEIIAKGATARSIQRQDDVEMFFDHRGLPLARSSSGSLILRSDSMGLYTEARIDPTSSASMEIVSRLRRGELDAMSFAFEVKNQRWEDDEGHDANPATAPVRRILETKLHDVSVVSFPANPATVAQSPSRSDGMSVAEARAALAALQPITA